MFADPKEYENHSHTSTENSDSVRVDALDIRHYFFAASVRLVASIIGKFASVGI